jgi:hypothetical protein
MRQKPLKAEVNYFEFKEAEKTIEDSQKYTNLG